MQQDNKGEILLYQTADGQSKIEVTLSNDSVWLSLDQMAVLFQRTKSTISRHIKNVFESGELNKDKVVAIFATTTQHGAMVDKTQTHEVDFYNLDMIISVGYRVNSYRGVQFRIWATQVLKEYLVKGSAMNDELLKRADGGNYFDELWARIRDIRSSEKIFYRKILEIYALSIDYDPRTEATQHFFSTVQNKMHFSAHGHTAAEVIFNRADAYKDFMGFTSWTGSMPKISQKLSYDRRIGYTESYSFALSRFCRIAGAEPYSNVYERLDSEIGRLFEIVEQILAYARGKNIGRVGKTKSRFGIWEI